MEGAWSRSVLGEGARRPRFGGDLALDFGDLEEEEDLGRTTWRVSSSSKSDASSERSERMDSLSSWTEGCWEVVDLPTRRDAPALAWSRGFMRFAPRILRSLETEPRITGGWTIMVSSSIVTVASVGASPLSEVPSLTVGQPDDAASPSTEVASVDVASTAENGLPVRDLEGEVSGLGTDSILSFGSSSFIVISSLDFFRFRLGVPGVGGSSSLFRFRREGVGSSIEGDLPRGEFRCLNLESVLGVLLVIWGRMLISGVIEGSLDESREMCRRLRKEYDCGGSSIDGCGALFSPSSGVSAVQPFRQLSSHVLHRHEELSSSKK